MLSELETLNVDTILDYKKRIDYIIFHSSTKLIASDSDIDKVFKSMHQSIITKVKNYAEKDWIVLDVIIKAQYIFNF